MSHKIDLKVEYANKMAQENEALKAQLEALLEPAKEAAEALCFASHHLRGRASENMLMDMAEKADALIGAIGSTPAQFLAEIKAQVVEDEYRDLLHVVANQYDGNDSTEWSIGANHVFRLFAKEVTNRTNQLRQQGEQK